MTSSAPTPAADAPSSWASDNYDSTTGPHTEKAAIMAANKAPTAEDIAQLNRHARKSGEARELLRPDVWALWTRAQDDLFAVAMRHLSPREAALANRTRDSRGLDILLRFSLSPAKMAILSQAGVDFNAPTMLCAVRGRDIHASLALCQAGDFARLEGMARAGIPPPPTFRSDLARYFAPGASPRTALHLLAAAPRKTDSPAQLAAVVSWLVSAGNIAQRDLGGRSPLIAAISHDDPRLALALLDAGADPDQTDAKGRDALAVQLAVRKAQVVHGTARKSMAPFHESLEQRLLALSLRRELGELCAPADRARRPGL